MADTHHREAGQVVVGDVLVELPLPFVVAPQVRIVLVVSAEVDVGHSSDRWVKWANLDNPHGESIAHWSGLRADAADVVHQETVVADGPAGVQHRIEDIAI